jgi:hypothetical protein
MDNSGYGFYEDDEELIAVLGKGYLQSILSGQGIQKGSLILTNKRVYFKGKRYERTGGGFKSYFGQSVINVHDCVSGNRIQISKIGLLLLGILLLIVGGFFLYRFISVLLWCCFIWFYFMPSLLFALGVFLIIRYAMKKFEIFYIEYSGGAIGTNCGWFSNQEINEFQKTLSLQIMKEKKRIKG